MVVLEPALPLVSGMAYREFTDSQGVGWRVWSTVPSAGSHLRGGFEQGWLTFECTVGETPRLRRLVPLPRDWDAANDERLELMCKAADEVPRAIGRSRLTTDQSSSGPTAEEQTEGS
jgi:hypothetical protein